MSMDAEQQRKSTTFKADPALSVKDWRPASDIVILESVEGEKRRVY